MPYHQNTFLYWLSFFYFYCICGWIFESTYVSLKNRQPTNRGFMSGPWLPLYGSGAVLILLIASPFQASPVLVYFIGALGATILEYFTGEAMVRIFKVRYWDYSHMRFQLHGHICLTSSIAWGFLSLLMIYILHPAVLRLLQSLPADLVHIATFVVTVCMVYDFSNAFRNAMDLRALIEQAESVRAELAAHTAAAKEQLERKKKLAEATAVFVREALEDSAHQKRLELENELESIHQKMEQRARRLLLHNPGSRFVSGFDDSRQISARLRSKLAAAKNRSPRRKR